MQEDHYIKCNSIKSSISDDDLLISKPGEIKILINENYFEVFLKIKRNKSFFNEQEDKETILNHKVIKIFRIN